MTQALSVERKPEPHARPDVECGSSRTLAIAMSAAIRLSVAALLFGCVTGPDDEPEPGPDAAPAPGKADDLDSERRAPCVGKRQNPLALEYTYEGPARLFGGRLERQGAKGYSLGLNRLPANSGFAGRSELRRSDPHVAGGPRAELAVVGNAASRYRAGQGYFYGVRLRLMPNWVSDGPREDILFQWKNISDTAQGESSKSPDMFLAVKRNEFVLRITSDPRLVSTQTSPKREQLLLVKPVNLGAALWQDFVFQVRWSFRGDGIVRVWHKLARAGQWKLVANKGGPNMHNDRQPGYLKWGIYKPSWRSGPSAANRRFVFHDNIRVGRSFRSVEPGCGP